MLLAQAILPCVKDFGQVPPTRIGSISSPYICASVFGLKLAHMYRLKCGRVMTTKFGSLPRGIPTTVDELVAVCVIRTRW